MPKTVIVHAQQRWDYCCESRRTENSMLATLNELGQRGWELIDVAFHKDLKGESAWTAFLKRPNVSPTPAPGQSSATIASSAVPAAKTPEKTVALQGFDLSDDEFRLRTD
jgi:hypothetical protein